MNIVVQTIEKTKKWKPKEDDIKLKNKHFTKALTAGILILFKRFSCPRTSSGHLI